MRMKYTNTLVVALLSSVLVACSTTKVPTKQQALSDMQTSVKDSIRVNKQVAREALPPKEVSLALMPSLSVNAPKSDRRDERFDVSVNDVPAKRFFVGLVSGTPYNIVIDPDIQGTISLDLKNVTIPEVLKIVRDTYGYEYELTEVGYRISALALKTQIFTMNYLNVQRTGASQTEVSSGISSDLNNEDDDDNSGSSSSSNNNFIPQQANASDGGSVPLLNPQDSKSSNGTSNTAVSTQTHSDFWGTLRTSLRAIVGEKDGRSVILNPQAGIIVVRATPPELREVARYLDKIQNNMTRQVIIEAKVLEVVLNKGFQQGINWRLLTINQEGNRDLKLAGFKAFGIPVNDSNNSEETNNDFNIFSASASGDGFDGMIKLLSVQGIVETLSSPRIATVNNQKALIKVGQDEFFVTNISSNTTATETPTTSQDVELTPFFSGIALDITPQIDADGDVTLHVHPTVVKVTDQDKTIELSGNDELKLPLALSQVRETDSIVHAKNGQVVVIGGLMTNFYTDLHAMTPGFGRLPGGIGNLFRDTERILHKRELVILLRPVVVNTRTATEQLRESQKTLEKLDKQEKEMTKPVSIAHWFDKVD